MLHCCLDGYSNVCMCAFERKSHCNGQVDLLLEQRTSRASWHSPCSNPPQQTSTVCSIGSKCSALHAWAFVKKGSRLRLDGSFSCGPTNGSSDANVMGGMRLPSGRRTVPISPSGSSTFFVCEISEEICTNPLARACQRSDIMELIAQCTKSSDLHKTILLQCRMLAVTTLYYYSWMPFAENSTYLHSSSTRDILLVVAENLNFALSTSHSFIHYVWSNIMEMGAPNGHTHKHASHSVCGKEHSLCSNYIFAFV